MRTEDLRTLSYLGRALWADPGKAEALPLEVLGALALRPEAGERVLERAMAALVSQAGRETAGARPPRFSEPFFRLAPEERMVLSALHTSRWSYARIAGVLGKTPEQVAAIAWAARLDLAFRPGAPAQVAHPAGPPQARATCPEYDIQRPWTQSFLDEQLGTLERTFVQDHLLACEGCRLALQRARQLYYAVDPLVPRPEEVERTVSGMERILLHGRAIQEPSSLTFRESLVVFFARREIRALLLGGAVAVALLALLR